jgi:alkylation response protein AidB-like acyl-CoA dehydrogenase
MDFALTDEQVEIRDLSARLFDDAVTQERLREIEASDEPGFDRKLWSALAEAGLLGVAVPEEAGGLGLGVLEAAQILEQAGRTVAPVPLLTLLPASVLLARHGGSAEITKLLGDIAGGSAVVTVALVEPLGDPLAPTLTARREGSGWVLDGEKICVPAGLYADHFLVSTTVEGGSGTAVFLVGADAAGLRREPQQTIMYAPESTLKLDGVRVDDDALIGSAECSVLGELVALATAAACSIMVGVSDTAVKLTAEYTKTREQFGHSIALFQAVGQRAADARIDAQGIRLTTLQANWLLDQGLNADREVAVAKYFAAEAGQRVARAAQHLHGGMGVDREYPLHRYYIWAKHLELMLGSGTRQLTRLGQLLAQEPANA